MVTIPLMEWFGMVPSAQQYCVENGRTRRVPLKEAPKVSLLEEEEEAKEAPPVWAAAVDGMQRIARYSAPLLKIIVAPKQDFCARACPYLLPYLRASFPSFGLTAAYCSVSKQR